jgi:2,3-bisphosphoglycerate-dependent phosphoglycerate mutase
VPLSVEGKKEAKACGKELAEQGYTFDLAYTSFLKRAVSTLHCIACLKQVFTIG